ncbi:hypothetical protein P175DRAFT_0520543 [Aspergillus ochraceoroseus IBT 24754]|uniref:Uncharacterized protein n=1 Tax=Aspergillus ochraceoroseus IBT 24754 TaxID=1392256 RepID=A0A2T5M7Y3_9EURO|nr:uncharacterized protein P175DRAFT_0520543 [Aspergillus ochraceoroseus IBT 24754]PTU24649.1 hypothetical protein P175DRAFT_0520543 [Aspergillus ochraceoroseus IBT 24754]
MCKYIYHHYPTCGHISSFTLDACIEVTNCLRSGTPPSGHDVRSTHDLLSATHIPYCIQCEAEWVHNLTPRSNSHSSESGIFDPLPYISLEGLEATEPIITAEVTMTLPGETNGEISRHVPADAVMGEIQQGGHRHIAIPRQVIDTLSDRYIDMENLETHSAATPHQDATGDRTDRVNYWVEGLGEYEKLGGFRDSDGECDYDEEEMRSLPSSSSPRPLSSASPHTPGTMLHGTWTPGRTFLQSPSPEQSGPHESETLSTDGVTNHSDAHITIMPSELGDNGAFMHGLQVLFPALFDPNENELWEERMIE